MPYYVYCFSVSIVYNVKECGFVCVKNQIVKRRVCQKYEGMEGRQKT